MAQSKTAKPDDAPPPPRTWAVVVGSRPLTVTATYDFDQRRAGVQGWRRRSHQGVPRQRVVIGRNVERSLRQRGCPAALARDQQRRRRAAMTETHHIAQAWARRREVLSEAIHEAVDAWAERFKDEPGFEPDSEMCFCMASSSAVSSPPTTTSRDVTTCSAGRKKLSIESLWRASSFNADGGER